MWHQLTESDLLLGFAPAEATALDAIAGDQRTSFLQRAVAKTRGAIGAGKYSLGPDGTTPDQLDSEVAAIARWELLSSFPSLKRLQTEDRKKAADDAQAVLEAVRNHEHAIEPPEGWTALSNTPSGKVFQDRRLPGRMGCGND